MLYTRQKRKNSERYVDAIEEAHAKRISRYWLVRLQLRIPNFSVSMLKRRGIKHNVLNAKYP